MGSNQAIKNIFEQFDTEGSFYSAEIYGSGHINDTYLVQSAEPDKPDYILRRINQYVFKNPPALLKNIARVTDHLRQKKQQTNLDETGLHYILKLLPSLSGEYYVMDSHKNYWSLLYFIPDSKTLDVVENDNQAWEGGKAFGNFIRNLTDFPVNELHISIPHFHDVQKRLEWFREAINNAPKDRLDQAGDMITFLDERAEKMTSIGVAGKKGLLPLRVTHNDTKFNNVLLNKSDQAICIIDLDTVMPGYVHYDFGDALRTITNTGEEDDRDLSNVSFNLAYFKAFTRGYIDRTLDVMTEKEKKLLPLAPLMMVYEQTIRFLTDYLQEDKYYKIDYPEHNLQRTKAQLTLLRSMESAEDEIRSYIYSFMD
ncbi:MAG: phosphotransferase enzyme family protein [Bacteroidales bacterium]